MKTIHFEIDYHTQWGEHLVVIYSVDGARAVKLPLETNDGMSWTASAKIPASARHIRHAYTVTDDNGRVLRTEFNRWRIFHFNHRSEVYFSDAWADDTLPGFYHRVAFSQCLMLPPEVEQPRIEQASASSLLLLHAAPSSRTGLGRCGRLEGLGRMECRQGTPHAAHGHLRMVPAAHPQRL